MKIKYEARKHARIKKGSTKTERGIRRNFSGVECKSENDSFWWSHSTQKWFTDCDNQENTIEGYSSHKDHIYNLKSLIRFAKKHRSYLPKGTVLMLCSNFEGHNIYCII